MKRHIPFLLTVILVGLSIKVEAQYTLKDEVGILTLEEAAQLNQQIKQLEKRASIKVVLLVSDSVDVSVKDTRAYAKDHLERLGLQDSGLLVFHVPKYRKIAIEIGSKIQPYISDAKAEKILEEAMDPLFKEENFFEGFQAILNALKIIPEDVLSSDIRDVFLIDEVSLLEEQEKLMLQERLTAFFDTTGNRIWVRIVQAGPYENRETAEYLHDQLYDRKDSDQSQLLYYLGVSASSDGTIYTYPRVEEDANWSDLVENIDDSGDHYAEKWSGFGDDTRDLITYRLESKATKYLYDDDQFYEGIDRVVDLLVSIHNGEIKSSKEIDRPQTIKSLLTSVWGISGMILLGMGLFAFFVTRKGGTFHGGFSGNTSSSKRGPYDGGTYSTPDSSDDGSSGSSGGASDGY